MSFKLALVAGHYLGTAGKRCLSTIDPNETREWWLNDRIADKIEKILSEYENIEILRIDDTTGKIDIELKDRTNKANQFKADFYLSIHHNAGISGGSGGGIQAYVYTNVDNNTLEWQKQLYNELIRLTGLKGDRSNGLPKANLHEVRETNMPAVLLELGFMDSTTDVPIILGEDFANKCAQACVNIIVKRANLIKKTTVDEQKLYRVRTSWDNVKSQKGAFVSLDGAKICCQSAGNGHKVFDWNGTEVYAYIESEVKKDDDLSVEHSVAVYNLNYPIKTKIIDIAINRNAEDAAKIIKYILLNNSKFDINIAKAFFKISPIYAIDPIMAICQSILETGWFKYEGSAVSIEQHNYCGLGVTSNGTTGASFNTIEDGVRAQLQHLYAYGCKDNLPDNEVLLDPRFTYVTRGIASYWQELAGRWAVPGYDKKTYGTPSKAMEAGNTYGQKILALADSINRISVTQEEIQQYFNEEDSFEDNPVSPEIDINWLKKLIETIIEILFNLFKSNKT